MYLSRHVSVLAFGHHQVYTNVIRALYRCVISYTLGIISGVPRNFFRGWGFKKFS
jgi:hypothetical protein